MKATKIYRSPINADEVDVGIYRILWGGDYESYSMASVYVTGSGQVMVAPTNFIAPAALEDLADEIVKMEKIEVQIPHGWYWVRLHERQEWLLRYVHKGRVWAVDPGEVEELCNESHPEYYKVMRGVVDGYAEFSPITKPQV